MDPVIALVERSNQRGGRMLSVPDLVEAGTLGRREACWLLDRILAGDSWLVGARPGGAGKTTVMSALLAMLPPGGAVRLARPGSGWEDSAAGDCVVAYELGPGGYEAYLWGEELRHLARLAAAGCRVVANLHADTVAEAEVQLVEENGVAAGHFPAFGLFLPLRVEGGWRAPRCRVEAIFRHVGGAWRPFPAAAAPSPREEAIGGFLDRCRQDRLHEVGAVRRAWLGWLEAARPPA